MANFSCADQSRESVQRLRERRSAAPMQEIKVEPVRSQPLEAALARLDRPASGGGVGKHLADEKDLLAAPGNRLADQNLRFAIAIHFGGIDQRHAEIETKLQCADL